MFLSLLPSLPLSLKYKNFQKKKNRGCGGSTYLAGGSEAYLRGSLWVNNVRRVYISVNNTGAINLDPSMRIPVLKGGLKYLIQAPPLPKLLSVKSSFVH